MSTELLFLVLLVKVRGQMRRGMHIQINMWLCGRCPLQTSVTVGTSEERLPRKLV